MISAKQQSLSGDRMKILGRLLGISQRQMIVTSRELAISTYSIIGGKEFVMFYYELFKSVEQSRMELLQAEIVVQEIGRSGGKGMKRTGKFGGNNMSNFYSEEEGGDSEKLLLVDEQKSQVMKKNIKGSKNSRYKSEEQLNTEISCFAVGNNKNAKIKRAQQEQEEEEEEDQQDNSKQKQQIRVSQNRDPRIKNKFKQEKQNINSKKNVQKVGEQGQCCTKNKCSVF